METQQNLQRRFPDLDEGTIRKAVTDCDGHGGRAAIMLNKLLFARLQDDFPYADESMIRAVCEDCEINGGKPSEKLHTLLEDAPRVPICADVDDPDLAAAIQLSLGNSDTVPVHHATKFAATIESDSCGTGPIALATATSLAPTHLLDRASDCIQIGCLSGAAHIGPWEPLDTLAAEFRFNQHFQSKVEWLRCNGYAGWRRVLGDGNCFYRAFGCALLEQFIPGQLEESIRHERVASVFEKLAAVRFGSNVDVDTPESLAHKELLFEVQQLCHVGECLSDSEPGDVAPGCNTLSGSGFAVSRKLDLALVRALRQLVADYMLGLSDQDGFAEGLPLAVAIEALGYDGMDDFCSRVLLRMGVEAESVVLPAMARALGESFRVVFLDRHEAAGPSTASAVPMIDYWSHESASQATGEEGTPTPSIHIQLRPGHYDVLYADR